jgi:hypothetical protein
MSTTNYAKNKIMDFNFGGVSYTPPANFYLGLSSTTISTSGSNATEPVGYGYARVAIPNTKGYFSNASSGCLVNSGSIGYSISSGSWGTMVNLALWDSLTSGSIWFYTTLTPSKIVQDATEISFSASGISFSMT